MRRGTAYPATLVVTSPDDPRVDPMNARKFAARLKTWHHDASIATLRRRAHDDLARPFNGSATLYDRAIPFYPLLQQRSRLLANSSCSFHQRYPFSECSLQ